MNRSITLAIALLAATGVARPASSPISVSGAWSRPASGTAVVYATLRNAGSEPDQLIGASSPIATHVGLHQSYETKMAGMSMGGGSMGNMPMSGGMVGMRSVSSIPIPPGGSTLLKPGGYHLMVDLRHDLKAGDTIPLRLHFAKAGWLAVTVPVKPIP
jgi:copper(I)-binding protein